MCTLIYMSYLTAQPKWPYAVSNLCSLYFTGLLSSVPHLSFLCCQSCKQVLLQLILCLKSLCTLHPSSHFHVARLATSHVTSTATYVIEQLPPAPKCFARTVPSGHTDRCLISANRSLKLFEEVDTCVFIQINSIQIDIYIGSLEYIYTIKSVGNAIYRLKLI